MTEGAFRDEDVRHRETRVGGTLVSETHSKPMDDTLLHSEDGFAETLISTRLAGEAAR